MADKAIEFITSPFFQNYDEYSYQDQLALKTLELQFDKEHLIWRRFDLSKYRANNQLIIIEKPHFGGAFSILF